MNKIHIYRWMQIRRQKCAYKRTAKPADEKRNSASVALHIPSNDDRQMQ